MDAPGRSGVPGRRTRPYRGGTCGPYCFGIRHSVFDPYGSPVGAIFIIPPWPLPARLRRGMKVSTHRKEPLMATICVLFHSDTGNTQALAEQVAEGAKTAGAKVTLMPAANLDMDALAAADALAIGSPDYFSYAAGSIKTFFDRAYSDKRFVDKPCVCFGTHGGGAKVLDVLEKLAKACNLRQAAPGLLVQGKPKPADADKAKALGAALVKAVK